MKKIDIVVTYCNSNDKQWQKDYAYWKEKEIKEGIADPNNQQAFNDCRYRDWDVFKYWFRGVEQNCSWVNNIYLVVQNKNHIPEWLNTDNPKLKVVFHEDFIPAEFLPTFNAMTIEMFIPMIKGLSDIYITSDDDFYFLNETPRTRFFTYNDRPCAQDNKKPYKKLATNTIDGVFGSILNNNLDFESKYFPGNRDYKYGLYHLPAPKDKQFELELLNNHKDIFYKAQSVSKFRHPNNFCFPLIVDDLLKITNKALIRDPYCKSDRCSIRENTNFNIYADKEMTCFNDGEYTPYSKKDELVKFFKKKFPQKSSFEKKEEVYLVEANSLYKDKNVKDADLKRIPEVGEQWYVNKHRLNILLGNNYYEKPFVKVITKEMEK